MAAELLREGASVRHIQLQLGHSDLSTTAAYLESIQPLTRPQSSYRSLC